MNTIALAIASIVDANTSQGYTRQFTKTSVAQIDTQIQRGRQIRAKSVFDLVGAVVSWVDGLIDSLKERAQERRGVDQILRLNDRMLKDIGLAESDVQGLRSGVLSLDDIQHRRNTRQLERKANRNTQRNVVRKSILDLESANQDCFELAKCS